MLFILVMEALNHFLRWAEQQSLLTPVAGVVGSRVSLYADDLVIFLAPSEQDLWTVRTVLQIFGSASGLFANLEKSKATPIHCSEQDMDLVTQILQCQTEQFPTRYLGVPLSVRKLKRADEQPLLDRVAGRIPGWKGQLLNQAGRTALVKATLSAIPVHTSIALCLSPWAVSMIDKLHRAFIWAGSDSVIGGRCKVAWPRVCRPKELGGLGVTDLRRAGVALRVRWVLSDRLNGRLLASNEPMALALFQAATVFRLGNGRSTFFWTDRWLNGSSVQMLAPTVFRSVNARKKKSTVEEALQNFAWVRHIQGPTTLQLLVEFAQLCDVLEQVQLSSEPDTFVWRFSGDGAYSAASAYGAMFLGSAALLGAKEIWKTAAPPRVRFFFWLTMHGRCWTGDRRFRHGLQDSNACVSCDQAPETMDHILLGCVFSRQVWVICLARVHLQDFVTVVEDQAMLWWLTNRKRIPKALRRGFDSLFFLVGWSL